MWLRRPFLYRYTLFKAPGTFQEAQQLVPHTQLGCAQLWTFNDIATCGPCAELSSPA